MCPSPACQSPITAVSTLSRSACFFYAAFGSLDPCGHHRAACSVAGVLGRRGFAVESAAARVCREAGARVSLKVRVQDMDLALPDALDNCCLEIVADGLPLFQGAQLAVDTTLVSVLRRDGVPRQRSTTQDGAALMTARRRKERVYPELTGQRGRTRLVAWPGKWEAGGPRNAVSSSTSWRRPRPDGSPGICARGLARCGGTDGRLSWLAALPKPLPFLCWSTGAVWVPMVTLHSPLR